MTANATEKRLLTPREPAERLDVSIFTLRRLAAGGVLLVVRLTPKSRDVREP